MGAKKSQYIKSIGTGEIANNWPLGAVPFSIVRLFCYSTSDLIKMSLSLNKCATLLSDTYQGNKNSFRCFTSKFDENQFGFHLYCFFHWLELVNSGRANRIDPYRLVYPERSTLRFLLKVRTCGIEEDLVKF